jgi:hypothetical protein
MRTSEQDEMTNLPQGVGALARELWEVGITAMKGKEKATFDNWFDMDRIQKRGWYAIAEHLLCKSNRECVCEIYETCNLCKP